MIDTGRSGCTEDHEVGRYCDVCDVDGYLDDAEVVYRGYLDDELGTATPAGRQNDPFESLADEGWPGLVRRYALDVQMMADLARSWSPDAFTHLTGAASALRDALDVAEQDES